MAAYLKTWRRRDARSQATRRATDCLTPRRISARTLQIQLSTQHTRENGSLPMEQSPDKCTSNFLVSIPSRVRS